VTKVNFELLNQFFRDASYLYYVESNELVKEEKLVVQFDQVNLSEEPPQIQEVRLNEVDEHHETEFVKDEFSIDPILSQDYQQSYF
jgi:hypothetical protein